MSGEELDKKLTEAGYVKAEIARLLGVPPQSVNQSLNVQDVKSGFLEDLCRVLNLDMSFFYEIKFGAPDIERRDIEISALKENIETLKQENKQLKEDLYRAYDPEQPKKDSKVYSLWMRFMEITSEWQELYKDEKKEA